MTPGHYLRCHRRTAEGAASSRQDRYRGNPAVPHDHAVHREARRRGARTRARGRAQPPGLAGGSVHAGRGTARRRADVPGDASAAVSAFANLPEGAQGTTTTAGIALGRKRSAAIDHRSGVRCGRDVQCTSSSSRCSPAMGPAPGHRRGLEGHRVSGRERTRRDAVRFTDYPGRYVPHCHNLEHEEMAMMATFTTHT